MMIGSPKEPECYTTLILINVFSSGICRVERFKVVRV